MTTNILGGGWRGMQLSQERIVFAIAAILFVAFSILLNNFLTTDNILSLIQNVSILGIHNDLHAVIEAKVPEDTCLILSFYSMECLARWLRTRPRVGTQPQGRDLSRNDAVGK